MAHLYGWRYFNTMEISQEYCGVTSLRLQSLRKQLKLRSGGDKTSKSYSSGKGKKPMSEYSSGLDAGSLVTAKKRKVAPSTGGKKKRLIGKLKKK